MSGASAGTRDDYIGITWVRHDAAGGSRSVGRSGAASTSPAPRGQSESKGQRGRHSPSPSSSGSSCGSTKESESSASGRGRRRHRTSDPSSSPSSSSSSSSEDKRASRRGRSRERNVAVLDPSGLRLCEQPTCEAPVFPQVATLPDWKLDLATRSACLHRIRARRRLSVGHKGREERQ